MKGPLVSILTPIFNHERYLGEAVASVQAQTYSEWELLLWDDGSTDGSLALARKLAEQDSRIRVFAHPGGANFGQEATRNAALYEARGELIALLDSDDLYSPDKLARLVPLFEDPQVGLAYGSTEVLIQPTGERIRMTFSTEPSGFVLESILRENFMGAVSVLIRRSVLSTSEGDVLRFDSNYKTMGEYPLWIEIAKKWKFAHVDAVVATWREHGVNTSTRRALEGKREMVDLTQRLMSDPFFKNQHGLLIGLLAQRQYDELAAHYQELDLVFVRSAGASLIKNVSGILRVKTAVLLVFALLGRAPNVWIHQLKRWVWERRHPLALKMRISRRGN